MSSVEGFLCAILAVLFFGSNFAVTAKYEAGDGMFFQLVLCAGVWFCGLVVQLMQGCPTFYPLALLGGFIWCTGNCMTILIIKAIGLGPGLVTWGTAAMLVGWISGFFGLFGLPCERQCMSSVPLNIVGFCISILALVISTLVKKDTPLGSQGKSTTPPGTLLQDHAELGLPGSDAREVGNAQAGSGTVSRPVGIAMAIFAGCCYGSNFFPTTHIQLYYPNASQEGRDYVFNEFCGIFGSSMLYFVLYAIYMGNKPVVNPQIIVPGFISGLMWGIAQTCWFIANVELGYATAFPIVVMGPGFVGCMWSVFLFKDIYGRKNYMYLAAYFLTALASCICIVLSKKPNCVSKV